MALKAVTGSRALKFKLYGLEAKVQRQGARKATNAGLTVLAREIRKKAPTLPNGSKLIKKSIGKRFKKNKKLGVWEAKAGVSVGKSTRKRNRQGDLTKASQKAREDKISLAHLFVLGTVDRPHPRTGRSGRIKPVPGADFVKRAEEASGRAVQRRTKEVLNQFVVTTWRKS